MALIKQIMTFAKSTHIAPNVLHVYLKPEKPLEYSPGQFVTLHFFNSDTHKDQRRSYSIANPPNSSEYIEFAISYQPQGIASEAIFHMKPGEEVEVSGPAGRLVLLQEHPERYVLVATGTGVTPYRAMLNQIKSITNNSIKVLVLFGIRNEQECLYQDEFDQFAKENNNFNIEYFYSRELPSLDAGNIHKGYVQNGFENYNLNPETDMIYLCGNPNMIDQAYAKLQELGFNAKSVRREKYISSK